MTAAVAIRLMVVPRFATGLCVGGGVLVLLGWAFDIAILKSVVPGWSSMKPNTASAFILAGTSLWLLRTTRAPAWAPRAVRVCATLTCLIGLLTLFEYAVGWDLGIGGHVLGAQLQRGDGKVAVVDFSIGIVDLRGERLVLSIGRDVTEQRLLEQQFRQAQKMEAVGRLAGGVAHDFNNLLTAIFGYADLMGDELPEGGRARQDLAEIKKAAMQAASLTRQLLAFSRQQLLQPVVMGINDLLLDVEKCWDG